MISETGEIVALAALRWIAAQEELLPVFMGATGVSRADLRARADDPELLAAVLDFLAMDDAWVQAFCRAEGLPGTAVMQARQGLPGGDVPHWT